MVKQTKVKISNIEFVAPFTSLNSASYYKKRTLAHHAKQAGVYMIKEDDRIVYVGMSQSNVVSSLYRHFYSWSDRGYNRNRHHVTYFNKLDDHDYKVVIITTSKEDAPRFEQSLIITLNPRDNIEQYTNIIEEIIYQNGYVKKQTAPVEDDGDDLPF
jgi:hypothetical protein